MSFYRIVMAAIAALGLATAVFAEESTTATSSADANKAAVEAQSDQAANATQEKVNVNKATAKELVKVKGLNTTKAKAIVAYRKKHGDFKSLDDLKLVKGFKKMDEKTMKDIQDQLTTG